MAVNMLEINELAQRPGGMVDLTTFRVSWDLKLQSATDIPTVLTELTQLLAQVADAITSKLTRMYYSEMVKVIVNKFGVTALIEQTRNYIFETEFPSQLREAVLEMAADYQLDIPDNHAKYGVQEVVSADYMFAASAPWAQYLITSSVPNLVVLNGAGNVAEQVHASQFLPIDVATTKGMHSEKAVLSATSAVNLRALLALDPLQKVRIIEDVVDTLATMLRIIKQILIIRRGGIDDRSHSQEAGNLIWALQLIENLEVLVEEMNQLKKQKLPYDHIRTRVKELAHNLLARLGEPGLAIEIIFAANKLLDNLDTLPNIHVLAPSFAQRDGKALTGEELWWLMGSGLDTPVKIAIDVDGNQVPIKIEIGRNTYNIFAFVGEMTRLHQLVIDTLAKFGINQEQISFVEES